MTELDLTGGEFTWEKSKETTYWVKEKLDRAFENSDWWSKFPLNKLSVTYTIYSDHEPICIDLFGTTKSRK